MRAVVQRVRQASVSVGEDVISSIGRGLCVLIGIHRNDTEQDIEYMQFTLYCELKGNKPDYRHAMTGESAQQFYDKFLTHLCKQYKSEMIKDGKFGAKMEVHIENDGPVTINIESPQKKTNDTHNDAE
ncbi:D-aminoacyl-tRNA deacylase [Chionoecetes opilio]|uniref:D-aminoacyl-tRNA deacylase n=1 Tax=Chionoecetes opilio TaxID=41210 RepID=A0A8J5CVY7_CHIOP|nr:D-aminoacyl-tRNA deacylase [Chionoecetes opilio]